MLSIRSKIISWVQQINVIVKHTCIRQVGKNSLFIKFISQEKHASPNYTWLIAMEGASSLLTHINTLYKFLN